MVPTTILVDGEPRCVVRPIDLKDLNRFLRNGRAYLLRDNPEGKIGHRVANEAEVAKWRNALALHEAWGGADDGFFGTPL